MTFEERETMENMLHYAVWCERYWQSLREKPVTSILGLHAKITKARELLEVKPDDA